MSKTLGPMTPAKAVGMVASGQLVLPGIQRSFVWKPRQIESLFDSLVQGFPIGSMLLWSTRPSDNRDLRFRRVVTHFVEADGIPRPHRPPREERLYAVLDGQQRLTALNIGLRGSRARSHGVPATVLHVDLDVDNEDDAGSEKDRYSFGFRERDDPRGAWFPVPDVQRAKSDAASLDRLMQNAGIDPNGKRRRVLKAVVVAINTRASVRFDVEHGDLDRVLQVFARTNRGGTRLAYADLLVSMTTTVWKKDPREAIETLAAQMNQDGTFKFTTDRIMKAGLVLLDVPEPKFRVETLMAGGRARRLEREWPRFAQAMVVAAQLLKSFGLTGRSLPAENVVIPIAYYAWHRKLRPSYVRAHVHERDRDLIKAYVARTVLTRGYWTGAVDAVLTETASTIKSRGSNGFPLLAIEQAFATTPLAPKTIGADTALVDELCELRYGDRRTIVLLSLLFPHILQTHLPSRVDKDHVFPASRFRGRTPAGMDREVWAELVQRSELLPNLQLLLEEDNRAAGKSDQQPKPWLAGLSQGARRRYTEQGVKHVPDLAGCGAFWDRRQEFLRGSIEHLLRPH